MQSEYFLLFAHCIVASSICTYGGLDFCENICIAMCEINFYINAPKYEMRECWLVVVASTFKFCSMYVIGIIRNAWVSSDFTLQLDFRDTNKKYFDSYIFVNWGLSNNTKFSHQKITNFLKWIEYKFKHLPCGCKSTRESLVANMDFSTIKSFPDLFGTNKLFSHNFLVSLLLFSTY